MKQKEDICSAEQAAEVKNETKVAEKASDAKDEGKSDDTKEVKDDDRILQLKYYKQIFMEH